MYQNKYLKYKNKYLNLKNEITQKGGSVTSMRIEDIPLTITNEEYKTNINENSLYYNPTCLHTKLSDLEIARNLAKRKQDITAQDERIRRRIEEISSNPNVVLSDHEYNKLTPQQKALGWVSFTEGPQWDMSTSWRRQTLQDRQRDINNQHNREIESQMNNILRRGTQKQFKNYPKGMPEFAIRDDNYTYVQLTEPQYNEYKHLESQLRK